MAASTLNFKIVTPASVEFAGEVQSVTLQSVAGEITVLPNHAALVSLLVPGPIVFREGGKERRITMKKGVLEVFPGSRATIVGETETAA